MQTSDPQQNRYLIAVYAEWYDYDPPHMELFSIEYESLNRKETEGKFNEVIEKVVDTFKTMGRYVDQGMVREHWWNVRLHNHPVLRNEFREIGHMYEWISMWFEIIQLEADEEVNEELFHGPSGKYRVVKHFFTNRNIDITKRWNIYW
jgi:hypothetical protein